MVLALKPVCFADGDAVSYIMTEAFFADRMQQRLYPGVPMATKLENWKARWPKYYSAPSTLYSKIVDSETGEAVSFAKWEFVSIDADDVLPNASDIPEDVVIDNEERSEGLDKPFAEAVLNRMKDIRPLDLEMTPHLCLVALGTLTQYQGRGAASMHLKWACDLADKKRLPVYLDAAPTAKALYTRHGFIPTGSVDIDLETDDNAPFTITGMMRQPSNIKGDI